jgi:hypothetical protein
VWITGFVPRLLERFARSDHIQAIVVGTGLGLAIARSYARASRGEQLYVPRDPRGACFELVLPVRSGDARPCDREVPVLARGDEALDPVDRVPDVDEARVERRQAEPDRVRAAEVRDDVRAGDECLAHLPRLLVA